MVALPHVLEWNITVIGICIWHRFFTWLPKANREGHRKEPETRCLKSTPITIVTATSSYYIPTISNLWNLSNYYYPSWGPWLQLVGLQRNFILKVGKSLEPEDLFENSIPTLVEEDRSVNETSKGIHLWYTLVKVCGWVWVCNLKPNCVIVTCKKVFYKTKKSLWSSQ